MKNENLGNITINIGNRSFETHINSSQNEIIFRALYQAFEEIDELKDTNRELIDKINSIKKKR